MPNLTSPCDLLAAAADIVTRSGAKDYAAFKRELEAAFGPGMADDAVRDLHEVARDFANKEARAARRATDASARRAAQMAGLERTGFWEALGSMRKLNLLGNIRTIRRNFEGNAVQALRREGLRPVDAVMDMLLSLKSGRRTVEGGTFFTGDFKGRSKATIDATIQDVRDIVEHGVPTSELDRLDSYRETNTGGGSIVSKAFDGYVRWAGRFQAVQDRPWYQAAYHRSLEEQANLMARAEAKADGKIDVKVRSGELRANPTEAMEAQAIIDAEVSTFGSPNKIADFLNGASTPAGQAMVDLFFPFKKVPANIAADVLTANPVGAVFNAFKYGKIMGDTSLPEAARMAAQKRLAGLLTNGVGGTALLAYGWQLAEAGILSPPNVDDKAGRDTNEALGVRPASVLIGGERRSLGGLHPLLNVLALGAAIHQNGVAALEKQERQKKMAARKGMPELVAAGLSEDFAKLGFDLGDLMTDQPFYSGAKSLVDALKDDRGAGKFASDLMSGFVPTAVPDLGALVGDNEVVRSPEGALQGVQNRIPGLRSSLPPKVTALGETIPAATGLSVADIYSTKPDPRNGTDKTKAWMFANRIQVSKPSREPGESAADYSERLIAVGRAVKERLDLEAQQTPHPDAQDKERIQATIQAVRRGANARYMLDRRARRLEMPPAEEPAGP